MLSTIKIFAIVSTAVFGVLGSIQDFRSANGNITIAGWIGIVGTIFSAALAGSIDIYESSQDEKDKKLIIRQNEQAIESTRRSIFGFEKLSIEYEYTANWNDKDFEPIVDYFNNPYGLPYSDYYPYPYDMRLKLEEDLGSTYSAVFPPPPIETPAGEFFLRTFCEIGLEVLFFKERIKEINPLALSRPDLRINRFNPECSDKPIGDGPSQGYTKVEEEIQRIQFIQPNINIHEGRLESGFIRFVSGIIDPYERAFFSSNGTLISLYDLLGGSIVFLPHSSGNKFAAPNEVFEKMSLQAVRIRLSNGLDLHFKSKDIDKENFRILGAYIYDVPDKFDDLLKELESDFY